MYVDLVANSDLKDFRFRVPNAMKDRWQKMIDDRRLGVQDGFIALMESVLEMDDLTQAMLFKQVDASPDLIALVMSQIGKKKPSVRGRIRHGESSGKSDRLESRAASPPKSQVQSPSRAIPDKH